MSSAGPPAVVTQSSDSCTDAPGGVSAGPQSASETPPKLQFPSKFRSDLLPFLSTAEMIMSQKISFEVKFVPAGTGSSVWDDPHVDQLIHRFMPRDRKHGPMLGVFHLGAARPTPGVLWNLVVTVGEDVKAGRYGDCTLFICSEDEDTRSVIGDVASSRNVALFVCSSTDLKDAEPAGVLTANDRETLRLVSQAGGTVTALGLAEQVNIEKTAAGNRLVSLQKKGYLQRVEQPHPAGDLFVDPRSVNLT